MGWKCASCGFVTEENLDQCPECEKEVAWQYVITKLELAPLGELKRINYKTITDPSGRKHVLKEEKEKKE